MIGGGGLASAKRELLLGGVQGDAPREILKFRPSAKA